MVSSNTCEEQPTTTTVPTPAATFPRNKQQPHHHNITNNNASVKESLSICRHARRPEIHRSTRSKKIRSSCMNDENENNFACDSANASSAPAVALVEADEKVEEKIMALQRIVPGGESLGVDKLFEETAGYIMALQLKLKALRALTNFVEGSEKEKRKLGG